jgi:hypothetical protein
MACCWNCGRAEMSTFLVCTSEECVRLRATYKLERLKVERTGYCVLSGAETHWRLPSGDYLWPEYVSDFIRAGWIDADLNYTEAYYRAHPQRRRPL